MPQHTRYNLHLGDMTEVLQNQPPGSVDSIVTDPPYGFRMGHSDWGNDNWDHGVPGPAFWKEALRVAKPGAHLLAFGGTRTYHRLTCAIEDAGWEIRDCIMWVYASGFPKSHNVGKAIDKELGANREKIMAPIPGRSGDKRHTGSVTLTPNLSRGGFRDISQPVTDAARQWDGWGTALKPAWEPIIVARKPLDGTVAKNVLEHGTGAINIGGSMNPWADAADRDRKKGDFSKLIASGLADGPVFGKDSRDHNFEYKPNETGRWPTNLIHDGSDEVLALFPDRASRFFYCPKATKADRGAGNIHPTVKPNALMRYLVKLVTPPDGIVLDPFMGSGSTGKAALMEGFRFMGVELNEEFFNMAKDRMAEAPPPIEGIEEVLAR
jgi:DNA modification methylase